MQPTHFPTIIPDVILPSAVRPGVVEEVPYPPDLEPLFVDPQLQDLYSQNKVEEDGKLRLDNIVIPEQSPLQPDAIQHIRTFMITPFLVQGILSNELRKRIKDALKNRLDEPVVQFLLKMDFMTDTKPVPFKASVYPVMLFLNLLDACKGNFVKLIGGESRRALKNTFIHMVEIISQKPCTLTSKKENDFALPCPDWDFIIPSENASFETLTKISQILPNIVTALLFDKLRPTIELRELLQFVVREVMFKMPEKFQENYFAGISFGNSNQKIDITFLPRTNHNYMFEFNKVGLKIKKGALFDWVRNQNSNLLATHQVTLDVTNCGPDKGFQAGFDFIKDILRATNYQEVNEKGFSRLMLWISKGQICYDVNVLYDFHKKLLVTGKLGSEIGRHLKLSHESHNMGNTRTLMATFLNTFVALDLLHKEKANDIISDVRSALKELMVSAYGNTGENLFEILIAAFQKPKFNTRYVIDFLTICAFLGRSLLKPFYGKTALQLTDGFSLLLPFHDISAFENVQKNYSIDSSEELKHLFNRLLASPNINPSSLDYISENQQNKLKELALNFLEHPDKTLQRMGLRLLLFFLKSDHKLYVKILTLLPDILLEESNENSQRILNYIERCSDGSAKDVVFANAVAELSSFLKKSTVRTTILRHWMYNLIKTKHPELVEKGMHLWEELSPADKSKEAQHYIDVILNIRPEDALSIYVKFDNAPQSETLSKIVTKLKNSTAKFISYGLNLEKALIKTLDAAEQTNLKFRKKIWPNLAEYFWVFCHLTELLPDKTLTLMQKMHAHGCLDLHQEERAHALIALGSQLDASIFIEVWRQAVTYGCPLLTIHSKEKNACLVHLCEDLFSSKYSRLDSYITHALTQNLDSQQTQRIQKIIMQLPGNDNPLRSHLSREQIAELAIARIHADLKNRDYLDATKEIDKIWGDISLKQQQELLSVELFITGKLLHDLDTFPENERQKQLSSLRPFFNKKLSFIPKVKATQVSRDLAEAWGLFVIKVYERSIAFSNNSSQVEANSLVKPLVTFLINNHSYELACELLKVLSFNKINLPPTPESIALLSVLVEKCPDVKNVEQTLTLLKFYQNKEVAPKEQQKMYVNLVNHLIAINSPRATQWMERILSSLSAELPLDSQVASSWMDHPLIIPQIYAQMGAMTFNSEKELVLMYLDLLKRSECPYFSSKLIADHLPDLTTKLSCAEVEGYLKNILTAWIQQETPETTDDLVFCLKLFVLKDPHIWCQALKIISQSNYSAKSDSWLLFEVSCGRGVYEEQPSLRATACLHALKSMADSEKSFTCCKALLQEVDTFPRHIMHGTVEEKEEAILILFKENIKNLKLIKDPIQARLFAMQLLAIRAYQKYLKPFSRVDNFIITEFTKIGDTAIFQQLLTFIKREFSELQSGEFNHAIQLILSVLPAGNLDYWSSLCFFLNEFSGSFNPFPLFKIAIQSTNRGYHLSTGILLRYTMNRNPQDNTEKITVSCLTIKIAEILSKENRVLREILSHPNVHNWLSGTTISKCWEYILIDQLKYSALTHTPLTTESLELFRNHFVDLEHVKNLEPCLHAGNSVLVRLLVEGAEDLPRFRRELISFFTTLLKYKEKPPMDLPRDPQDLPRPTSKRKIVCHSKDQMVKALQNLKNLGTSSIEIKRKGDFPVYSFPSTNSFFEFMIEKVQIKDEIHSPDFIMRGFGLKDIPDLGHELRKNVIEESIESTESSPEILVEFKPCGTLEFLFTEKSQRAFYVLSIHELIKSLCSIRTGNLEVRKTVISLCATHLLFLIENYSEYKDTIYAAIDCFVFASAAVDFQHGLLRTERGKEKGDQDVFSHHNDWCHEILTSLQNKFSPQVTKYPHSFYEAMLVIYTNEIYPLELTPQEQAQVIFRTISRLVATNSSVHYAKAIEILRLHQNLMLNTMEGILASYQELINALLHDPNYLIHEKHLILFGPEDNRKECLYVAKRPLFVLLNEAIRDNTMLFGKAGMTEHKSSELVKSIETAKIITSLYYKVMFELLENDQYSNPNFDTLYVIIVGINDLARRGCFVGNLVGYRDFILRAKRLLIPRLRLSENKKETLQFLNLPNLFMVPFSFQQRSQREHWLGVFNSLIKDLLEIKDKEMNDFLIQFVKNSFIGGTFFTDCNAQLAEIKRIISEK